MKPVEQRGDSDCLRACLASILDLAYEDVPENIEDPEHQHNNVQAFLRARGLIGWNITLDGSADCSVLAINKHPEVRYVLIPVGYWIAGVKSPRTEDDHAVVMKGSKLVWDPHPQREMGHRGFTDAMFLMPWDAGGAAGSSDTEKTT